MEPWQKIPHSQFHSMIEAEQFAPYQRRPAYGWFRSFSRRGGSLLRFLLIATLSDRDTVQDDILSFEEESGYSGKYVEESPLAGSDTLILDPMMGSGPTLLEGARLGVDVIGFDYNPVLWWVLRQTIRDSTVPLDAYSEFLDEAKTELDPYIGGADDETVLAYLLSLTINCPHCQQEMELHTDYVLSEGRHGTPVYLCPNTDCAERVFKSDKEADSQVACDECTTTFVPEEGNFERATVTCTCGYRGRLAEYFDEREQRPTFSRYAVYRRVSDGEKSYRSLTEGDESAIERAERQYRKNMSTLPVPTSKIEEGKTTRQLLRYNLTHYRELFTERQRFLMARLFEIAEKQSPEPVAEQLVTIVASTLHYNNALTTWNSYRDDVDSVFRINQQSIQAETVEANPLAGSWKSSIEAAYGRFEEARSYLDAPYEMFKTPAGEVERIALSGESLHPERIKRLSVSSADRLDLGAESVDCIVVDPPYYDNVQYGELLDFYYVWLREVLHEEYPEFSSTHTPKLRELSVNQQRGKDVEYYHRALRNAFEEMHRVLSTGGDLLCLFSIKSDEAWREISQILIKVGFEIRGAFPLTDHSGDDPEGRGNNEVVIFARKHTDGDVITFETTRQNFLYSIHDMIEEERQYTPELSMGDLMVILRARGLAEFSSHYPNVLEDGESVAPGRGVDMVREIIDKTLNP